MSHMMMQSLAQKLAGVVTTLVAVPVAFQVPSVGDPVSLIDWLSKGSSVVLAVVVVALIFGWLVPGAVYREALGRETRLTEKLDTAQKTIADTAGLAREIMDELKWRRADEMPERGDRARERNERNERRVPSRGGGSEGG